MPTDTPAQRYYRSLEGRWSGQMELAITDASAGGEGARQIKRMAALSRLVGGPTVSTTLHAEGENFRHTTRVTKWGALILETTEVIVLDANGRDLVMRGEQRELFAAAAPYEAKGEIDEDASGATYTIPFAGEMMIQRTRILDEGLELAQETPFSRAKVLLRRAG